MAASIATAAFNQQAAAEGLLGGARRPAHFDGRTFALPDRRAALLYLHWRSEDAVRNSVSMAAETAFPSKRLHGVPTRTRMTLLEEAARPWESLDAGFRYGRLVLREPRTEEVRWTHRRTGVESVALVTRTPWAARPADRMIRVDDERLAALIPEGA